MTAGAIIMMVICLVVVFGGFGLALARLMKVSKRQEEEHEN